MSLTRDEVANLLSIAAAYDGREPSEALMAAWMAQADIGRWTYDHAALAIHEHFSVSEAYLMPTHITTLVRQRRNLEAERAASMAEQERVAALPPPDPARAEHIRMTVDGIAQALSWPTDEDGHYSGGINSPLMIECPWAACKAQPGNPCHDNHDRPLTKRRFHPSREDVWNDLTGKTLESHQEEN